MTEHDKLRKKKENAYAQANPLHKHIEMRSEYRKAIDTETLITMLPISVGLNMTEEEVRQQHDKLNFIRLLVEAESCRELFEFAPDGYLVTDATGLIREASGNAGVLLNVEPTNLVGKSLAIHIAKDHLPNFGKLLNDLPKIGTLRNWDLCVQPFDGDPIMVVVTVAESGGGEGKDRELRWLLRDINERVQVENALPKSAARFYTAVETMLDCFGIFTAVRDSANCIIDFCIQYANQAACEENRITSEEQIGKSLCEIHPDHRDSGLFDEYCQVVETGQPVSKVTLCYADDYSELSRAFDFRVVKFGDGVASVWRDVTEQVKAKEIQHLRNVELEKEVERHVHDMQIVMDATFGREVRMAELKKTIKKLRKQLIAAGIEPVATIRGGNHI